MLLRGLRSLFLRQLLFFHIVSFILYLDIEILLFFNFYRTSFIGFIIIILLWKLERYVGGSIQALIFNIFHKNISEEIGNRRSLLLIQSFFLKVWQ